MLWQERGGHGERLFLLLHGLGATGAVWRDVCRELDDRSAGEWLVVDLPGHGGSSALPDYSVGAIAAAVAAGLDRDRPVDVIGHSLGVYVGLALASGWFGTRVTSLLGVGPKVSWTDAEVASMVELARKPARIFEHERDAWARFRKVSGIDERVAPDPALLARGVIATNGGFRLATDSRTPIVACTAFATLAASARCPVELLRGEADPMMTLAELRTHCPTASDIPSTGHNAHVEAPTLIATRAVRLARTSA